MRLKQFEEMSGMSQTDKMLSRKEGKVGYLTFNNPERHNAVSLEMWEVASDFLEDFKNDKNIRVVVVTGAGGKAFISGADISKFEKERSTQEGVDRYNAAVDRANNAFYSFPKPTIAMIRGYCIGGGVGLALCCDMRICTEDSKFGVPAAKLGLGYRFDGQGDFLHCPAIHGGRGADDGFGQSRAARLRARELRQRLCRDHRG
jgi:enoyl-CoA hydratase/carnithine racemase